MNPITQKYNSLTRYVLWHFLAKKLDLIHVVEYPKSGGTWLTQLISDYLGIYYPRNVVPKFKKSVIHGHYEYSKAFNKTICVIRDGRDIAVSYYHHMLLGNEKIPRRITEANRRKLGFKNPEDVRENLPEFIRYLNEDYTKRFNRHRWSDFIDSYLNRPDVLVVKYEDMLADTKTTLIKSLEFLGETQIDENRLQQTIEKYSFKSQSKREAGEENKQSFLRKGISGDWKNYFSPEAVRVFKEFSGDCLLKLGYEAASDWDIAIDEEVTHG